MRVSIPGFIFGLRAGAIKTTPPSIQELNAADSALVCNIQEQDFEEEIQRLMSLRPIKSSSKIIQLNPLFDEQSILHVGGRIRNSGIKEHAMHSKILPAGRFSELFVQKIPIESAHAGTSHILALLRQKFWLLRAVSLLKILRLCVSCR